LLQREECSQPLSKSARTPGAGEDVGDRRARRLDQHRQPQRLVRQRLAVMDRLPGQAGAQPPAVALDHADPARDVVDQLVAAAEGLGRHGRAVVLQADPARDHDRRGQDQLQRAEARVGLPVVAVQEGPAREVRARRHRRAARR
jgi:hypothetical protein